MVGLMVGWTELAIWKGWKKVGSTVVATALSTVVKSVFYSLMVLTSAGKKVN